MTFLIRFLVRIERLGSKFVQSPNSGKKDQVWPLKEKGPDLRVVDANPLENPIVDRFA
jgi:hypothetical protein